MNPVDGGFNSVDGVDGSGAGDVGHIGSTTLVRARDWDGLGGGLRGIN